MNIPTTAEIRDSIINAWEQRLSVITGTEIKILKKLKKSVLFILATCFAPIFRLLYLFVLWALNQTDPQTADDENVVPGGRLQQWGRLVKIGDPKPGQAPRYEIDITGTNGSILPAGAAYRSNNGNIYLLEDDIIIAAGVATGIIKAIVSVDRTNTEFALNVDDEVRTVNPFTGVDNPAIVSAELTAPTDSESIEGSYRPRVVSLVRIAPQGGARIDYRRWARGAEGVQDAYPYANVNEPGVVDVYIEATTDIDPDGVPTQAVLDAAETAIKYDPETGFERKPLTAFFFVYPIAIKIFDIEVSDLYIPGDTGDYLDAREKITTAITNTLKAKKPFIDGTEPLDGKNDIVSRAELLAVAVFTVRPLGGTIGDLVLKLATLPIESYTLRDGNKSKAGGVTFL